MRKILFLILTFILCFNSICFSAEVDAPKVLARVNGEDITEAEIMPFLLSLGGQAMMLYNSEQGRKMIIDEIISIRLFALDAENKKLDQTPEFQARILNVKRSMLAQELIKEVLKDSAITEEDAKNFYAEHINDYFTRPEQVHAKHILISDDVNSQDNIIKIQDALKNNVPFEDLAQKYSLDPGSAQNGGDLGEFPRGMMVPEFEQVAFNLKNSGDISQPVKTQFGWHIIKLENKIPSGVVPFEDVKEQLMQELQNQKNSELIKKYSDELEQKYKVERF